jgi:hypothetical protein
MVEAGGVPPARESFQEAFARIQSAVESGDTDLARLGFWRLVRQVKTEPMLSEHWADQAGRIDRMAFEARVRPRFPVWLGNLVLLVGVSFGAAATVYAIRCDNPTVSGLALIAAGGAWSVSVHDLAHWVVGRLERIRFLAYFIQMAFPPRPGLKVDYATYLRAGPESRVRMHASGALATKIAPFVALAFWPAADAPAWAAWALVAMGLIQITTDVLFSTKRSDWKRVKRERAVARAQAGHRR